MNAHEALACSQAHLLIQAELDRPLRTDEAAIVRAHLAECADCRAYRADIGAVQSLLLDAGHGLAHRPHAMPDLTSNVQRIVRTQRPRQMLMTLAQATAQFGGLALVALLVWNGNRAFRPDPTTVPVPEPTSVAAAAPVRWKPTATAMRVSPLEFLEERSAERTSGSHRTVTGGASLSQPGFLLRD